VTETISNDRARRCSACGVVAGFFDEQVSLTQILVLPVVPLPGRDDDSGRPVLHDVCRFGAGTSGGGTCFSHPPLTSLSALLSRAPDDLAA